MLNIRNIIFFFSLFLSTLAIATDLSVTSEDKTLSKLIRSNAIHYWSTMKTPAYQAPLAEFITYSGVVTGDPHFGNFSLIPMRDLHGRETLEFTNIDFDDAGEGPFIYDFLRLVVASKAIEWDLNEEEKFANVRDMLAAYTEGLNGQERPVPRLIQNELNLGIANYRGRLREYVDKRVNRQNKIKVDGEEVVTLPSRYNRYLEAAPALFAGAEVLDMAQIIKDRGGSANSLRFWVLVRENGEQKLYELKQWQITGMSAYGPQKPMQAWAQELYRAFWPGKSSDTYKIVNLAGTDFWLREKKKTLIDVPYEIANAEELEYLQQLSPYVANYLGQVHGRQASSAGLKTLLSNTTKQEALRLAVKDLYKSYLEAAQSALNNN